MLTYYDLIHSIWTSKDDIMVEQIIHNWTPGIIQSFIGSVAFAIVLLIFPKARKALNDVAKWINSKRYNPSLKINFSLAGEMNVEITQQEFENFIKNSMKNTDSKMLPNGNNRLLYRREFNTFSIELEFAPSYLVDNTKKIVNNFTIIIRSNNIKLKDLKEDLFEVQTYLFKDLVIDMSKGINFTPIRRKENIEIFFDQPPTLLNTIKDLNFNQLVSRENNMLINLFPNKMSIHGNFEKKELEKIDFLVRKMII